ncbi:MAG: DUF4384 domain-containing protein [Gammaproteobacteria bacterium]|nr:DUF4384 domain-containing protein [Gammaproteobacteria bacterium]
MRFSKILFFVCMTFFISVPASVMGAGKHALLIGINDYSSTPFSSLKGPLNDLAIVETVLRERFGFSDTDFIFRKDKQATHSGIEAAFKALIERAKAGDFVYIHYSGHGSRTMDLNGDERSGKDQTWVSYGSRASSDDTKNKDNYDVLDDEIDAWLNTLHGKTDNVAFVSDSCHSATVYRGYEGITRRVEDDKREHLLGWVKHLHPQRRSGVHIGSARDRESAIEIGLDDGKMYGIFTWYWVQALQQARSGETWNDVFKRAYALVTARRGVAQRPQLSGERRRQVLGGGFSPLPATVAVSWVRGEEARINAGQLAGVTADSIYRLYKPGNQDESSLPRLKITRTTAFSGYGKVQGDLQAGDLLTEESHAYPFPAVSVYLHENNVPARDKPLLQALRSSFQQDEAAYTLTGDKAQAELHLALLRPKRKNGRIIYAKSGDPLPQYFPKQPAKLWVLTSDGHLYHDKLAISFADPARGVQLLEENLTQLLRIRELKALHNRSGGKLPVTIQAWRLSPVEKCQEGPDCLFPNDELGFLSRKGPYGLQEISGLSLDKGEIISFTLHNGTRRDYYLYLINIAPDGAIYALFPPAEERAEYALVKAGETRNLLNDVGLMAEQAGEETIKIIITRKPVDITLVEHEGFKQHVGVKGRFSPLERLLINAAHGLRGEPITLRNDSWTAGETEFAVK